MHIECFLQEIESSTLEPFFLGRGNTIQNVYSRIHLAFNQHNF